MTECKINSKNHITIQGWMVTELGLSGNELLCYALIYGFCQNRESVFHGSSTYISQWLSISKVTVFSILKKLQEKGLIRKIEKQINGVKCCDYETLYPIKFFNGGNKETLWGGNKETLSHNNIIDNIEDNNIYISSETEPQIPPKTLIPSIEEHFDKFWSCYPKQRAGSKQNAFKAYQRALKEKRATIEQLEQAVLQYAQSDEVKRGFAKGCAAWLNDDRFMADYTLKSSDTKKPLTKDQQIWQHNKQYLQKLYENDRGDDDYEEVF